MKTHACSRRHFLRAASAIAVGSPLLAGRLFGADAPNTILSPTARSNAKVAIAGCKSYGSEVRTALDQCFDLIGGIGSLVKKQDRGGKNQPDRNGFQR